MDEATLRAIFTPAFLELISVPLKQTKMHPKRKADLMRQLITNSHIHCDRNDISWHPMQKETPYVCDICLGSYLALGQDPDRYVMMSGPPRTCGQGGNSINVGGGITSPLSTRSTQARIKKP